MWQLGAAGVRCCRPLAAKTETPDKGPQSNRKSGPGAPGARGQQRREAAQAALHIATLTSFAIAQPLFDLLGTAPEFLLAHDLGPNEILVLTLLLGGMVPAVTGLVVWAAGRLHRQAGRAAGAVMMACLIALLLLPIVKRWEAIGGWTVVAAAALIGVMGTVAYQRARSLRGYATWLAPGIAVFPLVFLLRPGISSLVWPEDPRLEAASTATTPIVMVVFDSLPLASLLDENRQFDRRLYPSFAAFADEATWYRNATSVSDYTRWALPAIVTGHLPVASALPIASHHQESIFTLLGSSHKFRIYEPISRLCPETVCDHEDKALVGEMVGFGGTLAVAFLHAVAPEEFESDVPALDQGWNEGVPPSVTPGELWLQEGDRGRRGELLAFIDSMSETDPQPPFYFLHVLLPHTPFAYFPGGQRYSSERYLPGLLERRDRWLEDEWAVAQGYQRHLLQVGYVDVLLGRVFDRLRQIGLYDRALIVVTSDHGASFRPGLPFRGVSDETFMDILPIPLLIKQPDQREGAVSDRNVETIDIVPTVAEMIGVRVPWNVDGTSAVGPAPPKPAKSAYYEDAKRVRSFDASMLHEVYQSTDRKLALFGSSDVNFYRVPRTSPYHDVIGLTVAEARPAEGMNAVAFSLDVHGDFTDVDPNSDFLPAYLAGRARWKNADEPVALAIAVNGTIRATARTYRFEERGSRHAWSVVLGADAFRPGENDVEIFVLGSAGRPPVMYRAYRSSSRRPDLTSAAAAYGMGVKDQGFYRLEQTSGPSFRWTNGAAKLVVPSGARRPPKSLRVMLAMSGQDGKPLRVLLNGCELFNGGVPAGPWSAVFALSSCRTAQSDTVIELLSGTHQPAQSRDTRVLGVAVERIDLLESDWPPEATALPDTGRRSQIDLIDTGDKDAPLAGHASLTARIVNRGTSLWPALADLKQEAGSVRLGVLWFRPGRTEESVAAQHVDLPRTLFPGDAVDVRFALTPTAPDGARLPPGRYEIWAGLLQEGVGWFFRTGDAVRKHQVLVKD